MHNFDLIFFLKIRLKVWVSRIDGVYSEANLLVYETRKIRKMFEGGGN